MSLIPSIILPRPIEIIAHRGAGQGFVQPDAPPENTLPALQWAWSRDVDACEIDARVTADGRLIVAHDETTNRTTDRRGWRIGERTLEELQRLDAGSWKGPEWRGTQMPTLEEAIDTIPDCRRLLVELKAGPRSIPELGRIVAAAGKRPEQIAIISFCVETAREAKRALPDHASYLVVAFDGNSGPGRWSVIHEEGDALHTVVKPADGPGLDALIALMAAAGLDGIDTSFAQPGGLMRRIRSAGLASAVWTVNDPELAIEMVSLGITSITTDTPLAIRDALHAANIPTGPCGRSQRLRRFR